MYMGHFHFFFPDALRAATYHDFFLPPTKELTLSRAFWCRVPLKTWQVRNLPLLVTPSSVPDKHPAVPVSFTALLFNTLSCAWRESFSLTLKTPASSLVQLSSSRRAPHVFAYSHFRQLYFRPVVIEILLGLLFFYKNAFLSIRCWCLWFSLVFSAQ